MIYGIVNCTSMTHANVIARGNPVIIIIVIAKLTECVEYRNSELVKLVKSHKTLVITYIFLNFKI